MVNSLILPQFYIAISLWVLIYASACGERWKYKNFLRPASVGFGRPHVYEYSVYGILVVTDLWLKRSIQQNLTHTHPQNAHKTHTQNAHKTHSHTKLTHKMLTKLTHKTLTKLTHSQNAFRSMSRSSEWCPHHHQAE